MVEKHSLYDFVKNQNASCHPIKPYLQSTLRFIRRILAHRVILCGANENFDEYFRIGAPDKQRNFFQIEGVAEAALLSLIEFCYTGEIYINHDTVDDLLVAARIFRFEKLNNKCTEHYLCPANCLLKLKNADDILKEKMRNYALDHFMEVVNCEEFRQLDRQPLTDLLKSDNLNVHSEEDVFEALTDWVEFELSGRKSLVPELIGMVRMNRLDQSVSLIDFLDKKCHINCCINFIQY